MYCMYSLKENVKPRLGQVLFDREQVLFPLTEIGKRTKFGSVKFGQVDQKFNFEQDKFVMTRTKLLDI